MYGSQFHFEQTLAAKKFSSTEIQNDNYKKEIMLPSWMKFAAMFMTLTISSTTFASPSIPKITNPKIFAAYIK